MKTPKWLLFAFSLALLGGCHLLPQAHRYDVHQGNVLTDQAVSRIREGMTPSQVQFRLGTPMVDDFFHANQWIYMYTVRPRGERGEIRRLTLTFENDALVSIQDETYQPPR